LRKAWLEPISLPQAPFKLPEWQRVNKKHGFIV